MTPSIGHLFIEKHRLEPAEELPITPGAWRFVRVQSGAAYWIGENCTRPAAEGELIVLNPISQGCVRASLIGEVTLHRFHFVSEVLCGFFTLAERQFFETAGNHDSAEPQFFPSTHPTVRRFSEIIAEDHSQDSPVRRAELLTLVLSFLSGEMTRLPPVIAGAISAESRFQEIIARMPDVEFASYTPENLARLCGCSPRHFSRLFQQHFGISARERLAELRLLKARQLLTETSRKIAAVALECGYRNVSLFNAMFKGRFGVTPSAWREVQQDKNGRIAVLLLFLAIEWLTVT
jgi:AraC-like DNA-binding protein